MREFKTSRLRRKPRTNPRTRRVLKNRQVNSGSFTPHTVSPMQHLQAVIVQSPKAFILASKRAKLIRALKCRTDSPIVHIHFIRQNYCITESTVNLEQ